MTDFNASAYMGTWYEQVHVKDQAFEFDSWTCGQANYTDLTDDGHFKVSNTNEFVHVHYPVGINGSVSCPVLTNGQCFVSFFGAAPTPAANYIVVDTDYSTYSIVYACNGKKATKQYLWFLTRENVVEDFLYETMMAIAVEKLPNFNFASGLNHRTYQGPKCNYKFPTEAFNFLQ